MQDDVECARDGSDIDIQTRGFEPIVEIADCDCGSQGCDVGGTSVLCGFGKSFERCSSSIGLRCISRGVGNFALRVLFHGNWAIEICGSINGIVGE